MEFNEIQKFRQAWIWIGLIMTGIPVTGIFGLGIWRQVILGKPFGNHPMSDAGLIITFAVVLFVILSLVMLFATAKLVTRIDREGISYRFFPFYLKTRLIRWAEVKAFEVTRYNPVRDYGGWGIGSSSKGRAYNVSGDRGLLIVMQSGKNILIGTGKPELLDEFLRKLKPLADKIKAQ